jgi:hypothetical protein
MRARRSIIGSTIIAILAVWMGGGVVAQEQTEARELDLAAMALAPEDVPPGTFDDYFEWIVPAANFTDLIGAPAPAGFERAYQSFYFGPEQGLGIHVFLLEFASPEEAVAGASVVDALLRPPLPEGTTIGPSHEPGPALGDEPRTTTSVTYDSTASGGPRVDISAASFRRDDLIAGVSVEHHIDPSPEGVEAEAASSDPSGAAREEMAVALATTLDGRVSDVFAGIAPAGADLALPGAVLPIEQMAGGPVPILGGYKAGLDLLRCGICGEENSLGRFAGAAMGGYSRTVVVGPMVDGEPQPPFVSVAVSRFTTPEDALGVLEAIRRTPGDRPTPGPVPRGVRTLAGDPAIPGAAAAVAFHAALDAEDPDAPIDSAGVDFVIGDHLVTVDVQGGLSAEDAMATAVDLASQQAACLTSAEPCASVSRPAALGSPEPGD